MVPFRGTVSRTEHVISLPAVTQRLRREHHLSACVAETRPLARLIVGATKARAKKVTFPQPRVPPPRRDRVKTAHVSTSPPANSSVRTACTVSPSSTNLSLERSSHAGAICYQTNLPLWKLPRSSYLHCHASQHLRHRQLPSRSVHSSHRMHPLQYALQLWRRSNQFSLREHCNYAWLKNELTVLSRLHRCRRSWRVGSSVFDHIW